MQTTPQLHPLLNNPYIVSAIEEATSRHATAILSNRKSALPYQSCDGMARHGEFNRGLADTLKRSQRKSKIKFVAKKEDQGPVIGDLIVYDPFKGQVRFSAQLQKRRYQLLHMTGSVDEINLRLDVKAMGLSRVEYCQGQSSRVSRSPQPNLFDGNPEQFVMTLDDEKPTRIIIVTQRVGPLKDTLRVWMCAPIPEFDADEGLIELAEVKHLFDVPISGVKPSVAATRKAKPEQDQNFGIDVTKKQTG